jgi:short-subunit dehydrogenase
MRAQRSGRIVNVSSVLGFLPAPYMGLYSAAKHAVEGMSETLDHEVRQFGIRVSLVNPASRRVTSTQIRLKRSIKFQLMTPSVTAFHAALPRMWAAHPNRMAWQTQ